MQTKSDPNEIQSFLSDASFIRDGHADRVVLPETIDDVSEILARANDDRVAILRDAREIPHRVWRHRRRH